MAPGLCTCFFSPLPLVGFQGRSVLARDLHVQQLRSLRETDIYFGLQQIPMAILTFTLGAFGLAFTPAYSRARQTEERSSWTGGILALALLLGLAGSAITMLAEPLLLRPFMRKLRRRLI